MLKQAEYIWLDGAEPSQQLRSKTRVVKIGDKVSLQSFPEWGFDGSSTNQADGSNSDLVLKPVCFVNDPIRGKGNYLVLCEVYTPEGKPHSTNKRAELRSILDLGAAAENPWFGFEQEYTLLTDEGPLGWPKNGYPAPQGPYYCGVGTGQVHGRDLVEKHAQACIDAGLMFYGTNAEVMPAQWEFQVGYRGIEGESADPLTVSDHLWIGRWLLHRLSEEYGVVPSFDVKPMHGDWNGAGAHTNFSTDRMRDATTGRTELNKVVKRLEARHDLHVLNYGHGLETRLTGAHETCSISEFRAGVSDRGASIRIPLHVEEAGCGYLEDRRPGANCDPYVVSRLLLEAVYLSDAANEDEFRIVS
ncbi:MAG: glutamine synthetase beta-grasp domain-containing protein [Gammaproteobacteria bacterium]